MKKPTFEKQKQTRAMLKSWNWTNDDVYRMTMQLRQGIVDNEVHVNTMEGFWSLLRSWLRPHQGIS